MADAKPRPAEWIDRLTSLVMIAGVAGIVAASAPVVLRAHGWMDERSPVAPLAPLAPGRGLPPLPGHVTRASPHAPDPPPEAAEEEARMSEIEQLLELRAKLDPANVDRGPHALANERVASTSFTLRRDPTRSSAAVVKIQTGERVGAVREQDGFVLVIHPSERGADIGWAPKEALREP